MSKSALLPTASLTVFFLLTFLALPFISSADQIEDISEAEQHKPVDEGAAKNASSVWKRLLGSRGLDEGNPATSAVQAPLASPPTIAPAANQDTPVAEEKGAVEKPVTETVGQDRTLSTDPPVTTQKTPTRPSSSTWHSILASLGLHDDRPSIPPLEVKNTPFSPGQDYIIGPGDQLGISVWREDSLTRSVVVLPDGKIQFPLIGEVVAGGKSVAQLKQEFVEKLSRYVVDADISVEVKQSNSLFIYIIGRVNNPGRQLLAADTTVLQALAMAGGLNPFAEKDDIKVFRQDKDRSLMYSFRYSQVVSGNYLDDNLLLKRGDVIVVP